MKFNDKFGRPKSSFGPSTPESFGQVLWSGMIYECHNWPCRVKTGWVAHIEYGDGQTMSVHACSEECLLELANGCTVVEYPVQNRTSAPVSVEIAHSEPHTISESTCSPSACDSCPMAGRGCEKIFEPEAIRYIVATEQSNPQQGEEANEQRLEGPEGGEAHPAAVLGAGEQAEGADPGERPEEGAGRGEAAGDLPG